MRESWKSIWLKYGHFVPVIVYMIFYLAVFGYVEQRPSHHIHLLSSQYDALIPFCEFFIIPYFLWFFYIAAAVVYFGLNERDRSQFYALITNLCIGMTLFLVISLVWPNGHTLRPSSFERDNIFTRMVTYLWSVDTSTNVLPSIHVFNSVAVHTAIAQNKYLKERHPGVVRASLILCILIVLSTMFLKQHTVIDVVTALLLNTGTFYLVYAPNAVASRRASHSKHQQ